MYADTEAAVAKAGATTRGGFVEDSRLIRVTTLADDGPGSLREALAAEGPRVVVFDVGGTIDLSRDLRIDHSFVTVAGQTAPPPGILLRGAKLRVSGHDVVIQHIAVRPGLQDPVPNNADGISISPCSSCDRRTFGVRLENVSVSWAIDENIGLWGEQLTGVTLRNSIVAEALRRAGHEKGVHSMGMLIGAGVQSVEVVGNLFFSNMYRNPVVGARTSAFIANNFVYNPGQNALHLLPGPGIEASFVGNVVHGGADSDKRLVAVQWDGEPDENIQGAKVFARDNHCCNGSVPGDRGTGLDPAMLVDDAPIEPASWTTLPAAQVRDWVMRHAGVRPAERSPVDTRIIDAVASGSGKIIDDPAQVGGYPSGGPVHEAAAVPDRPYSASGLNGKTRLEAWLCLRHLQVGGAPSVECSEGEAELKTALASSQ